MLPPSFQHALRCGASVGGTLAAVAAMTHLLCQPLLLPPFAATCILVVITPDRPFAQPRNVVGGYLISCLMAVAASNWSGSAELGAAVAAGVAVVLMMSTHTLHPPGVAMLLLLLLRSNKLTWYSLLPVSEGVALLIGLGWLLNNALLRQRYPASGWW